MPMFGDMFGGEGPTLGEYVGYWSQQARIRAMKADYAARGRFGRITGDERGPLGRLAISDRVTKPVGLRYYEQAAAGLTDVKVYEDPEANVMQRFDREALLDLQDGRDYTFVIALATEDNPFWNRILGGLQHEITDTSWVVGDVPTPEEIYGPSANVIPEW